MFCLSLAVEIRGSRIALGRRYYQSANASGQLMIFFN